MTKIFCIPRIFVLLILSFLVGTPVSARPTFAKNGLVVSGSDLASEAGAKIMQKGGNAADAAVATAFVLAVTRPYYGALGGGGFMLIKFGGEISALDYRERAPRGSKEDMYKSKKSDASTTGGLAVATPGNVRGLFEMHKKFGKLPWAVDVAPAIEIAKNGFIAGEELVRTTREEFSNFTELAKNIFKVNGKDLAVGDRLKQPHLAQALEIIQKQGADGFYKKTVAEDIVQSIKHADGILDSTDLEIYKPVWRKPLKARVFGVDVYTMPPPSSGGALLLEELKLSEVLKVSEEKPYSEQQYHLMAEIMSRAFFDRQYIADPQFTTLPIDELYRDERIQEWADTINRKKKTGFDPKKFEMTGRQPAAGREGSNTTHYVTVDSHGNVVSATTTLNGNYGSGIATEKYGIFLNNEMDDFTTRPGEPNMFGLVQGSANAVAPQKTPLSSMTPTLVEKDGKLLLALGSPGGPKIINAVYQVLFHALTTPFNLDEVIQAPRIHHQGKPDKLFFDHTLSPDTVAGLERRGHTMVEAVIARVYGIRLTPEGLLEGAFDSRNEGGASGF